MSTTLYIWSILDYIALSASVARALVSPSILARTTVSLLILDPLWV